MRHRRRPLLLTEELERRTLLSGQPLTGAIPLVFSPGGEAVVQRAASPDALLYSFTLTQGSRLSARVATLVGDTRLSLLKADGTVLVQSDGVAPGNPDDHIDLHLGGAAAGTTYYLRLDALGGAAAGATLTVDVAAAIAPFTRLPTGSGPLSKVADVNHDGIPDVVSANYTGGDVSVLLGRGDGTFAPERRFAVGGGANDVAFADFDGDGHLDLATANYEDASLSILRGHGDGTFDPAVRIPVGQVPSSLVAGDFNHDGRPDLAFSDFGTNEVVVLLGTGSGFGNPAHYAVGGSPYYVAAADLNGDGLLDLVTANSTTNDVSVLLGAAGGGFRPARSLAAGMNPYTVTIHDLDGDGHPDLVSGNVGSNDISVFYGNGDGTFAPQLEIPTGAGASMAAAGDFNEDGVCDLVVTNWDEGTLSVLLGARGRRFLPQTRLAVGSSPAFLAAADLNGDGHLDLAHSNYSGGNVSVSLGRGDGTFLMPPQEQQGAGAYSVLTGDLNRDGIPDLVSINYGPADVIVLLGRGDGTFLPFARYKNGSDPSVGTLADVTGDGILDLVLCDFSTGDISLARGRGDGTFDDPAFFPTGSVPIAVVAGDFNGDGWLDLAVANQGTDTVTVLLNDGAGSLLPGRDVTVGDGPDALVQGDFNGDGIPDLASANSRSQTVSVLTGRGDGTFTVSLVLDAGPRPTSLVAADLNGDGRLDLALANYGADTVSVFLAGAGAAPNFAPRAALPAGPGAFSLVAGHFDAGPTLDLAVANRTGNSVGLLLGDGAGGFAQGPTLPAGQTPLYLSTADLNGDGRDDLVAPNYDSSDLSVYLGGALNSPMRMPIANAVVDVATGDFNGDGFTDGVGASPHENLVYVVLGGGDVPLGPITAVYVPGGPSAVATGDFNRDGRLDFAATTMLGNEVVIFLGRGDGTFTQAGSFSVGQRPLDVVAADLDGDGRLDLATSNDASGDVSVLYGRGDGSFSTERRFQAGAGARALAVADLDGDGRLDLVSADELGHTLTVLLGRAGGGFLSRTLSLAGAPHAVAVADVNGDSRPDLLVASLSGNFVQVLLNRGGGSFSAGQRLDVPGGPIALDVGDLNRDGRLDLAVARHYSDDLYIGLGQGDGTFQAAAPVPTGQYPTAMFVRDLNNDGRPDLFNVNALGSSMTVNVGRGDGTFADQSLSAYPVRSTPITADFNHDGIQDVAVLEQDGTALVRLGESARDVMFAPPLQVNPQPGQTARDIAVARVAGQAVIVTADSRSDSLSLYSWNGATGSFVRGGQLAVPATMPVRVLAGDVNGDGRDDLIAATATGKLFVWLQSPGGAFGTPAYEVAVGVAPLDLAFLRPPGAGRPAIAVLDSVSGDVRVLLNDPAAPFAGQLRYRAGAGLTSLLQSGSREYLTSSDNPVGLIAGDFNGDGRADLISVDQGAHSLAVLFGTGDGLLNAASPVALETGQLPLAAVARDFNGDGVLDLAVLDGSTSSLTVYLGDGRGGFRALSGSSAQAGEAPTGLTAADLNGDGKLDLLVGNTAGDVLTLMGNGDGTFQPYRRLDRGLALAVADLDHDGHDDFVISNQAIDRVTVRDSETNTSRFTRGRGDGIRDPGRVKLADLNGDGVPDLIVVNGGGNNVLVYLGLPGGRFGAPVSFFAGTEPAGVTVADLDGDHRLDLVIANEGSNDVSVLLGRGDGGAWTLSPGPRLSAGAGPVATLVRDVNGDGIADLLVCNAAAGTVSLLHGVGGGFFDDRDPVVFRTGARPTEVAVGEFDGRPGLDLVSLDEGSDEVSFFSGMGAVRRVLHTGRDPVAMLAGDFNGDGYEDLVVASHEDNALSLLLGESDGPQLAATLHAPGLLHPGDLALAGAGVGSLELYVLLDSQDVTRLTFVLEAGEVRLGGEAPAAPGQPLSDFSASGKSLLEGVTTLLLGDERGAAEPELIGGESGLALRPMPASGGGEGSEEEDRSSAAVGFAEPGALREGASGDAEARELNAFVLGLDGLPFERRLQEGLAREREEPPAPVEAIDELFRAWRAPAAPPPAAHAEANAPADSEQARSASEGRELPRSLFGLGEAPPDAAPADLDVAGKEEAARRDAAFLFNPSSLVLFVAPYAAALAAEETPRRRRMTA